MSNCAVHREPVKPGTTVHSNNRSAKNRENIPNERVLKMFTDEQIQKTIERMNNNAEALQMVLDGASFPKIMNHMGRCSVASTSSALKAMIRSANRLTAEETRATAQCPAWDTPYPQNLIFDILRFEPLAEELPPDVGDGLNYALSQLTEREQKILYMTYADGMTLEAIGKDVGISRERVRQIQVKALRRLRHPSLKDYLTNGYAVQKEIDDRIMQRRIEKTQERWTQADKQYPPAEKRFAPQPERPLFIRDVGFSCRVQNVLIQHDIRTLHELVQYTPDELMSFPAFGRGSLGDVCRVLDSFHMKLATRKMPHVPDPAIAAAFGSNDCTSVFDSGLSNLFASRLWGCGICTLEQLAELSITELLTLPWMTPKRLGDVEKVLCAHGLRSSKDIA